MHDKLRLRAVDVADLAVISACLQDARVELREMVYMPAEQRFMAAFTRYRRELQDDPRCCDGLTEQMSMLTFDGVSEVKYKGIDPSDDRCELSLLTIATMPGSKNLIHIELVFAGNAWIQMRTDAVDCRLDDFGEAEVTQRKPCDHFVQANQEQSAGHADHS